MADPLTPDEIAVFKAPCASCGSADVDIEVGPDGVAEVECRDCGAWELIGGDR